MLVGDLFEILQCQPLEVAGRVVVGIFVFVVDLVDSAFFFFGLVEEVRGDDAVNVVLLPPDPHGEVGAAAGCTSGEADEGAVGALHPSLVGDLDPAQARNDFPLLPSEVRDGRVTELESPKLLVGSFEAMSDVSRVYLVHVCRRRLTGMGRPAATAYRPRIHHLVSPLSWGVHAVIVVLGSGPPPDVVFVVVFAITVPMHGDVFLAPRLAMERGADEAGEFVSLPLYLELSAAIRFMQARSPGLNGGLAGLCLGDGLGAPMA